MARSSERMQTGFDSLRADNQNDTIMEEKKLRKMNYALGKLRNSAGSKAAVKVQELRERYAIIYELDGGRFYDAVRESLYLNVREGTCKLIDRSRIPE